MYGYFGRLYWLNDWLDVYGLLPTLGQTRQILRHSMVWYGVEALWVLLRDMGGLYLSYLTRLSFKSENGVYLPLPILVLSYCSCPMENFAGSFMTYRLSTIGGEQSFIWLRKLLWQYLDFQADTISSLTHPVYVIPGSCPPLHSASLPQTFTHLVKSQHNIKLPPLLLRKLRVPHPIHNNRFHSRLQRSFNLRCIVT